LNGLISIFIIIYKSYTYRHIFKLNQQKSALVQQKEQILQIELVYRLYFNKQDALKRHEENAACCRRWPWPGDFSPNRAEWLN
jgi:hypothetical protein